MTTFQDSGHQKISCSKAPEVFFRLWGRNIFIYMRAMVERERSFEQRKPLSTWIAQKKLPHFEVCGIRANEHNLL